MDLVVGVDAGGTASRAVLATVDGRIVGRGRAGPGNPLSAGPDAAAAAVCAAVGEAVGAHPRPAVLAAVLGIAGTSLFTDPATEAAFHTVWSGLGLNCPMTVVGDAVTAFAAGSPARTGAVLIAGTGAIAALVDDRTVTRTADGLGWLLGDAGSGRWIGLETLRVTVRTWSSPLATKVAAHTGATTPDDLVRWAHRLPLPEIGALAPLVCAEARAADPQATAVIEAAVRHLVRSLDELGAEPAAPVVLAGGLLAADTPVRDGVLAALRARGVTAGTSRDPAAGAAYLAARAISRLSPAGLHAALLAPSPRTEDTGP